MKKILFYFLFLINLSGFSQTTFYCTKNINLVDCKVNFINNVPVKWAQLDATLITWSVDQVGSYIIKDGVTQVTIKNDGCLVSPTFANLDDSLIAWQSRCGSSIPTPLDVNIVSPIPLIVDNIGIDTVRVLDSVRVWFEQGLDTSNQGILNGIFGILRDSLDKNVFINNDSLRVYFNQILDTSNSGVLLAIHNLLKDSLDKNIFVNNDSLRVYFNDAPFVSDTANQSVLLSIHNLLKDSLDKNLYIQNDSLKVWFSQPLEVKTDTANQGVLNSIHNLLVDSLDKDIYILNDSIRVHFNQISDTANAGILASIHNLLVDSLDKNVFINNDSLRVWFEQKNDTIDFEYKTYCYRGKSDSGVYSLNVVFSALTPYAPIFMNFLNVDSLSEIFIIDNRLGVTFGTFPNIPQDYVPCEKWNEYLIANSKKDTTKGLVYTQIAKVRTDRDTLFNCKSLSFGRKGGASGNLILTYENGESETFNIATDDLPSWVNGEFLSYLDYNATGTTGLIVNTVGCSQTSDNICAKVKPVFDCELNIPIQCLGWQSASGVWQSASGCWNTGQ